MLTRNLYYALKPYLPWRVRMAMRRILARRLLKKNAFVWPINAAAAHEPAGWPGWPEGKKFAFVLTHDVEGPDGLAKCRALAELEMELGFRSSFNFIPEGDYEVPEELRTWLTSRGFEVGVHDLQHDGKLFQSRHGFQQKKTRINHYLRTWGSAGFRAGFMLRNLDWLHDLEIEYDASTFDTDPFEPQSDGAGTIFPYWIPSPSALQAQATGSVRPPHSPAARQGYVELPYTLPQDSTLFLLLREKTPEIWLLKLDWIASHRGMALINVHPDYMNFTSGPCSSREFPSSMYADLLRYARQKYAGQFWNPPPRELTAWFRGVKKLPGRSAPPMSREKSNSAPPHSGLRGKRVAVLLYSEYPSDPRPRRAAEAMIEAGMEVDLFCLAETPDEPLQETVRGVQVFRLPMQRSRSSKWSYLWRYARFGLASFWFLTRQSLRKKYDLVHVHNMPDGLVFSALLLKLRGIKVILDLHDPMPEVMMTIYGFKENQLPVRLVKLQEKWSIGFADAVLTVNRACHKLFSSRSCPASKVGVIMNSPDEGIFKYREPSRWSPSPANGSRPFVIMYHGSIVERHGLDLAVTALIAVRKSHPQAELRIYGQSNPFLRQVLQSVENSGLQSAVHYLGPKNLDQIVQAIQECDVGIIPNRRSLFTELNTPTRIFEYLSQGKPVIAPRAPGILDYFGPDDLFYFELGEVDDLARQIERVITRPETVGSTVMRGQAVYLQHIWTNERQRFLGIVAEVLGVGGSKAGPRPKEMAKLGAGP